MGRVSGRSCIVTGAAQGIGRAIAEALLEEGANVCFADLNGDKVTEVADLNRATYGDSKVIHARVDVTDRAAVRAMIDHTVQKLWQVGCEIQQCGRQQTDELSRCDRRKLAFYQ